MTASRIRAALAGVLALALLVPAGSALAQDASPVPEEASYLFVMSAASGSVDAETLALRGVPVVVWFTDRPYRDAGQMRPEDLAAQWPDIVAAFHGVPPNAVLSVLGADGVVNTVIELTAIDSVTVDATGSAADIVLRYKLVDGEMPTGEIGTASLFIDSLAKGTLQICNHTCFYSYLSHR